MKTSLPPPFVPRYAASRLRMIVVGSNVGYRAIEIARQFSQPFSRYIQVRICGPKIGERGFYRESSLPPRACERIFSLAD